MKQTILPLFLPLLMLLSATLTPSVSYAQDTDKYFPYPQLPDDQGTLSERCNYLVYHFWDKCPIKQSFSSAERLEGAFADWLSFMPYATADTVHLSIDRYLGEVAKSGGDNVMTIGKIAERWLYCDTAEYFSEELYLPFAKAASTAKKASKDDKAYFERQARVIESTGLGKKVPSFAYITADGETRNLSDVVASRVILFFTDPDCFDCTLAKARLAADYNLKKLIDNALVKIVCIYPADAAGWQDDAKGLPDNWEAGIAPEASKYFELNNMPDIYYLDARHKVLGKDIVVDNLLFALQQINQAMKQ